MSLGTVVTGIGDGLVSWGYGGGDARAVARPGRIQCRVLSRRLHIGDIAEVELQIYDEDDELADPEDLTVRITTASGLTPELVYGEIAETAGDDVIRMSLGVYRARIAITELRGVGVYGYAAITTGGITAADGGAFTVYRLPA